MRQLIRVLFNTDKQLITEEVQGFRIQDRALRQVQRPFIGRRCNGYVSVAIITSKI